MKSFIEYIDRYSDTCFGIAFAIFITMVMIGAIVWINTSIKTTAINDCVKNINNIKECKELFGR